MCRLMAYVGPPICCADLLFRPTNSIVRQSFDAKQRADGAKLENPYAHGSLNADGFGMAFYGSFEGESEEEKKLPCVCFLPPLPPKLTPHTFKQVFTELLPAWNSKNLRRLSEKVHAKLFFAHIRAAGPSADGQVSICDCKTHPFTFGRYSFMHNGEIAGFAFIRRKLLAQLKRDESFNVAMQHGASDTAVAFAIFVDQIPPGQKTADLPSTMVLQMLKQTLEIIYLACSSEPQVTGQSKLNFVVTDGRVVIATRYAFGPEDLSVPITAPSLYYCSGSNFKKPTGSATEFRISHSERISRMTIVSSEPLTEVKGDWVSVPFNHVVVIQPSGETLCGPLYFKVEPCAGASAAALELDRSISTLEEASMQQQQQQLSCKALEQQSFGFPPASASGRNLVAALTSPRLARMISCSALAPRGGGGGRGSGDFYTEEPNSLLSGQFGYEISFPYHVLAFSGQVHVSCMTRLGRHLFVADGGTTAGKVCCFSLDDFQLVAWSESWNVLSLACCEERNLLFGSRSDGKIIIWRVGDNVTGLNHAANAITIPEIGHVLTMELKGRTLYIGSQDGNLRRINVENVNEPFEVHDQIGNAPGTMRECVDVRAPAAMPESALPCAITRSHCGFVNATVIYGDFLYSAGSCSLIKRWELSGAFACVEVVAGHRGAVTDLCAIPQRDWLLSSSLDGTIRAWRVAAAGTTTATTLVKTFQANGDAITCLAAVQDGFCAGTITGLVWVWKFHKEQREPLAFLNVSASPINTLQAAAKGGLLFVGAKSGRITVWEIPRSSNSSNDNEEANNDRSHAFFSAYEREDGDDGGESTTPATLQTAELDNTDMYNALREFVAIPSVSEDASRFDACVQSANYIRQLMETLGGETRVVQGRKIPVVLGKISAARPTATHNASQRYVFVYGHHDVVDVDASKWDSPPFELHGREGYLFGRGVSDNKGPVLAMLFAAASLRARGELSVDVYFCLEGENETDMSIEERGFQAMLRESRASRFIPEHAPLLVVISNNTWITSKRPCLTYGMRGIVDVVLKVSSSTAKTNSAFHSCAGFADRQADDPVQDLVAVLSTCAGLKRALDEHVDALGGAELDRLTQVGLKIQRDELAEGDAGSCCLGADELINAWVTPAVTISAVQTSSDCFRKVPHEASAKVTVHFVPGLTVEAARELVVSHFERAFLQRASRNATSVTTKFTGKWWVGDVESLGFKAFSDAIERVWGEPPLLVRSGTRDSSMTCFLEREFGAPCVNFPMASKGDNAHQANECIKLVNLHRGRQVFEQVLQSLDEDFLMV